MTLRPATPEDVDLVFAWANDPVTRAASFRAAPIDYEAHVAWFARALASEGRHLFVALRGARPVAFVRLERSEGRPSTLVVSLNVAPEARGEGVGVAALRAADDEARALSATTILALIREENEASRRTFARAGYVDCGSCEVEGSAARRFERSLR